MIYTIYNYEIIQYTICAQYTYTRTCRRQRGGAHTTGRTRSFLSSRVQEVLCSISMGYCRVVYLSWFIIAVIAERVRIRLLIFNFLQTLRTPRAQSAGAKRGKCCFGRVQSTTYARLVLFYDYFYSTHRRRPTEPGPETFLWSTRPVKTRGPLLLYLHALLSNDGRNRSMISKCCCKSRRYVLIMYVLICCVRTQTRTSVDGLCRFIKQSQNIKRFWFLQKKKTSASFR